MNILPLVGVVIESHKMSILPLVGVVIVFTNRYPATCGCGHRVSQDEHPATCGCGHRVSQNEWVL